MNPELGRLIVSGKRNLLKFILFTNYCAPELPSENCILFLVIALIEPAVVFSFRGTAAARDRFAVDARAQAQRCQDPLGDSSLDRAGRALRALNHGRTAGASIAMPRALHRIEFEREGLRGAALVLLGAHPYHAIAKAAVAFSSTPLAYISAISCGRWRCRSPWNRGRRPACRRS